MRLVPFITLTLVALLSLLGASATRGEVELGRADLRALGQAARRDEGAASCATTRAQRVVSAALLSDELLVALGATQRLAGVSYVVDWPSSTPLAGHLSPQIPRVSGNAEEVLLLRPDLVVISEYTAAATEAQLEGSGLCVLRLTASRSFDDLFVQIDRLADVLDARERSAALIDALRGRLGALRGRLGALRGTAPAAARPRVLLLQGAYAYGPGTLQHDCLRWAGLDNALEALRDADSARSVASTPHLGDEQLLMVDPDLIFLGGAVAAPRVARFDELEAPLRRLRAARRGQVILVPAAWMASVSHHVVQACEVYARYSRSASAAHAGELR